MKLEKYVDKDKRRRKIILISISVIVLISVSLLLYKTFASFTESAEFPMMKGKVDYFGNSDIYFAFYKGDEQLDTMPVKDNSEGLVFDYGECDNGASIEWNESEWAPLVKGLKKVKTKCSLYFKEYVPTLADKLVECGKSGINAAECISDNHSIDESINESIYGKLIYAGENPANYILFNNELWRIIGVETVTDANDNTEAHLKIIKANDLTNDNDGFSWDSSPAGVNNGKGVNDWSDSDLAKLLNNDYLYSKDMVNKCYAGFEEETIRCPRWADIGINDDAREMLAEIKWNVGKLDSSLVPCCDEVTLSEYEMYEMTFLPENTWTGYIGLEVPSDYIYSSKEPECLDQDNRWFMEMCWPQNWNIVGQWSIMADMANDTDVFLIGSQLISTYEAGTSISVYPVAYLKSNIKIVDGKGTEDSPFVLEM